LAASEKRVRLVYKEDLTIARVSFSPAGQKGRGEGDFFRLLSGRKEKVVSRIRSRREGYRGGRLHAHGALSVLASLEKGREKKQEKGKTVCDFP